MSNELKGRTGIDWLDRLYIGLIAFLLVMGVIGWAKFIDEKQESKDWYTNYSDAMDELRVVRDANIEYLYEWGNCKRTLDFYVGELSAMPVCQNDAERIEYLEGQLDSCNGAYSKELHDRLFYQEALEDVPAYCSLGLNQFVIDELRSELGKCKFDLYTEQTKAPKTICGWDMLYKCSFGELGWIGPDREICSAFGNASYNEARTACFSDRNCSSCLQMTDGDLGHCYAFAYYP